MTGSYRILDDIALADVGFEVVGETPDELCRAAGQAVIELMADPRTVGGSWERTIEVTAESLAELLFDWLNQLVYLKDACGVLFHELRVDVTTPEPDGLWRLRSTLWGAPVDPAILELRSDIKAVTKHLYMVSQEGAGWRARIVVDV